MADGLQSKKDNIEKENTEKNNTEKVYLSAVQMSSVVSVDENLTTISACLEQITNKLPGQHLVVLPECCLFFGGTDKQQLQLSQENTKSNTLVESLSALAKQYQVYLVAGTIPLICDDGLQFTNSSLLFNPSGQLITQYDKIHLFDVDVRPNQNINDETVENNKRKSNPSKPKSSNGHYKESTYTKAGTKTEIASLPFAQVGLTVCFDLRFPTLFQALTKRGADIITVPSAFTRVTGKVHWKTLLRARAIENQVYVIASGQEGIHANGRETWGHSMIISPWGEILKCLEHGAGFITVEYKPEEITRIRNSMPLKRAFFYE